MTATLAARPRAAEAPQAATESGGNLPALAAGAAAAAPAQPLPAWRRAEPQRGRFRLAGWSFALLVALPTALAAVYYLAIAADQYVAEFRFGLRSAEPVRAEPGAAFAAGLSPTRIGLDSYVVVQYIASLAILDDLGRSLDLRGMFSTTKADWPARLRPGVPVEELAAYWR
ncbi:MAG TPA: hypothetical protein VGF07_06380, partial [Stellaceae bacterium]